jgi:hypothetical protein
MRVEGDGVIAKLVLGLSFLYGAGQPARTAEGLLGRFKCAERVSTCGGKRCGRAAGGPDKPALAT